MRNCLILLTFENSEITFTRFEKVEIYLKIENSFYFYLSKFCGRFILVTKNSKNRKSSSFLAQEK